jgi:hypothetical protein
VPEAAFVEHFMIEGPAGRDSWGDLTLAMVEAPAVGSRKRRSEFIQPGPQRINQTADLVGTQLHDVEMLHGSRNLGFDGQFRMAQGFIQNVQSDQSQIDLARRQGIGDFRVGDAGG